MFENKKIHFIGIGGISMSGIAEILREKGAIITGSDMQEGKTISKLKEKGFEDLSNIVLEDPQKQKDLELLNDMKESFKHKFAKKPEVIEGNMKAIELALQNIQKL